MRRVEADFLPPAQILIVNISLFSARRPPQPCGLLQQLSFER